MARNGKIEGRILLILLGNRKGKAMLYQSNMRDNSNIPRRDVVVMCERCWGIITHVEMGSKEMLKWGREKENVCLYCKKKERMANVGKEIAY